MILRAYSITVRTITQPSFLLLLEKTRIKAQLTNCLYRTISQLSMHISLKKLPFLAIFFITQPARKINQLSE